MTKTETWKLEWSGLTMIETSNWLTNGCPYCGGAYGCRYTPENPLGCYAHRVFRLYKQAESRMHEKLGNLHDDEFCAFCENRNLKGVHKGPQTDYEHEAQ